MPYSRRGIAELLITPGVALGLKVAVTTAVAKAMGRKDAGK